jgi:alkylation response protein AidB-like acyl-CoA dehydrogenase
LFSLVHTAMSLGIGLGAFDAALAHVRGIDRAAPSDAQGAARDVLMRRRLGDIGAQLRTPYLALRQAAKRIEEADLNDERAMAESSADAACIKVCALAAALGASSDIFEPIGSRGTAGALGLDRYWRDVRTDSLAADPLEIQRLWIADWHLSGTSPPVTGSV